VGRREMKPSWIAYPPGSQNIRNHFNELATMGWVMCKSHTPYTKELLAKIHLTLDKHANMLRKHPAPKPRCCYSGTPYRKAPNNSYPLRWLEVMGEISHPLMLKYKSHIKFGLPDVHYKGYR
jgi:hypothetical protein